MLLSIIIETLMGNRQILSVVCLNYNHLTHCTGRILKKKEKKFFCLCKKIFLIFFENRNKTNTYLVRVSATRCAVSNSNHFGGQSEVTFMRIFSLGRHKRQGDIIGLVILERLAYHGTRLLIQRL